MADKRAHLARVGAKSTTDNSEMEKFRNSARASSSSSSSSNAPASSSHPEPLSSYGGFRPSPSASLAKPQLSPKSAQVSQAMKELESAPAEKKMTRTMSTRYATKPDLSEDPGQAGADER